MTSESEIPGTSGKKVVVAILLILVCSGALIGYTLWCYTQVERTREHAANSWREAANELDMRYRSIEKQVAQAVDDESASMAWGERFRLSIDRFRTSASPVLQREAALAVETEFAAADAPEIDTSVSAELLKGIESYNTASAQEAAAQQFIGAQLLAVVLQYPDAEPFMVFEGGDSTPAQ